MTQEEIIKYLYEYSVNVDFDYEKTKQLCEQLGVRDYFNYIKRYLKKLKLEDTAIAQNIEEIKEKRNQSKLKAKKKLEKLNPVLLEHGKQSYYLWETEEDKKIVAKYLSDRCIELGSERGKVILAEQFGTSSKKIGDLVLEYHDEIKKRNPKEYAIMIEQRQDNHIKRLHESIPESKIYPVLQKILKARKLEEIIEIIDVSLIEYNSLKEGISRFSLYFNKPDIIRDNLNKKLDGYAKYKSNERAIERKNESQKAAEEKIQKYIIEAPLIVQEFLNSDLTLTKFLEHKDISTKKMSEYIEVLSEINKELYDLYVERTGNNSKRYYGVLVSNIKEVINYITSGIEINNTLKQFTILDYHMIIKQDVNEILKIAHKILNADDLRKLRIFIKKNEVGFKNNYLLKKQILESTYIINMEKDKDGNLIEGTGEVVSNETKNRVIDYLLMNKIPLNEITYSIAFKRYTNGELNIESAVR